ncbi:hypothetical protein GQ44DRAFT_719864 [Phaeosphaeriaceae sp. PMI808]|nr:hypothetical protein GQ44DRAFT_719864 [Phaeosphaeriaceae sp. PMI808]
MRISYYIIVTAASTMSQFTTPVFHSEGASTITSMASPGSMPTAPGAVYTPADTLDSWLCATKNYSDYLQPPMPTGHLLDIYYDHSDKIYEECEAKLPKPFTSFPACPSVAKASWCALSTAVPSSDLAIFQSYGSIVSSWWSSHSSKLVDLVDDCPNSWNYAKKDLPGNEIWLNATIALAECFAGDQPVKPVESTFKAPKTSISSSASRLPRAEAVSWGLAAAAMMF